MTSLIEFLLARIAEDEQVARAAAEGGRWQFADSRDVGAWTLYDEQWRIADLVTYPLAEQDYTARYPAAPSRPPYYVDADANGEHIARHDPARVLAECDAKRRIVEEHGEGRAWSPAQSPGRCRVCTAIGPDGGAARFAAPCPTLRLLALPYADHGDYRDEWRP